MDPVINKGYQTLIIEPFYGGSHQQLIDLLMVRVPYCIKYTLPAKKWHWKARTAALHFAQTVPRSDHYKVLFASSVLNLVELLALRMDLAPLHKVLYFHENQLVYPVRKQQDRDFQYGYNQIISCLVADTILFNSEYNMESFLSAIDSFLGMIPVPGYKSKGIHRPIRPKCRVLHFPLQLPELESVSVGDVGGCRPFLPQLKNLNLKGPSTGDLRGDKDTEGGKDNFVRKNARRGSENDRNFKSSAAGTKSVGSDEEEAATQSHDEVKSRDTSHVTAGTRRAVYKLSAQRPLHILWAHRWEHDKNPDLFFQTLMKLHEMGFEFHVSVLGEKFTEVPEIFAEAKAKLQEHILNWGYMPSKEDYYRVLFVADVAVSTADHEFYGVAMLEAVHLRCYPLCPNCLVYPEIFPKDYLYSTSQQLFKRLREFCRHPQLVRKHNLQIDVKQFSWEVLKSEYLSVLAPLSTIQQDTTSTQSPIQQDTTSTQSPIQQDTTSTQSPIQQDTTSTQSPIQQDTTSTQSPIQQDTTSTQSPIQQDTTSTQSPIQQDTTSTQSPIQQDTPSTQSTTQQDTTSTQSTAQQEETLAESTTQVDEGQP